MSAFKVKLLGAEHTFLLPPCAEREELAVAFSDANKRGGMARLRVYSAALGLCTRVGRQSSVDYASCKCDPLVYGGRVYGWLREQGASAADVAEAAVPVLTAVMEALAPREAAIEAQEDFSGRNGAPST